MLKKLMVCFAALIATAGFAFAQVDVNKADQAALDSLEGIGPKTSRAILDERKKGGEFKDWADFERRVKGVGEKSAQKLSESGLRVHGQPRPEAVGAAKNDKKNGKTSAGKDPKADAKIGGKAEAAPAAPSQGTNGKSGAASKQAEKQ